MRGREKEVGRWSTMRLEERQLEEERNQWEEERYGSGGGGAHGRRWSEA